MGQAKIGVSADTMFSTFQSGNMPVQKLKGELLNTVTDDGDYSQCTALDMHVANKVYNLLLVMFKDQSSLICTSDTKFLMSDGAFCRAGDLKYGDELFTPTRGLKVKEFAFYYKPLAVYTIQVCNLCARNIQLANGAYVRIGQ